MFATDLNLAAMMKKLPFYGAISGALLTLLIFYACHKDGATFSKDDPNAPMSIESAQNYFYNTLIKQPGSFYPAKTPGGKANWKYVLFKKGYAAQTPVATYVEIPLLYNQRPSTLIKPAGTDAAASGGNRLATGAAPAQAANANASAADVGALNGTFDRLLIYKDKSTNQIEQSIVTYMPDADYLARHNYDASHNQITKLDPDYNGYLLYRDWNDQLQFILKIKNGKSVGVFKYNSPGPSVAASAAKTGTGNQKQASDYTVCVTQTVYHYVQQCYVTVTEDEESEDCGDWELAGVDTYEDCYDVTTSAPATGDPCVDYGYCTTPTPPTAPPATPPTTSTADHKLPHPNTLPPNHTTNTQVGQLCVFKTMEWVSAYFGGTLSSGTALLGYATQKGLTIPQVIQIVNTDGIPSADLTALTGLYFTTAESTNLFTSINNGYPVMGTLINPDGSGGHEVMVTGWNNNGTSEYFDPQLGTYNTTAPINIHNAIEIHGLKP